jgi:thiaminase/transcriptional activator TenA
MTSEGAPTSMSAELWADSSVVAAAALAHPFVAGIADGTLPRRAFATFIAQDAYFLEAFARAYALALSRSPDTATLLTFADLIGGVRDELLLHSDYAARWSIDMAGIRPLPATLAYTEFLLATAATAGIDVVCAAMIPCLRLYAWLGSSLDSEAAGPYAEWVRTYADPQFESLAAGLESLLDALAMDRGALRTAYRRAMDLEVAFFDAAIDGT